LAWPTAKVVIARNAGFAVAAATTVVAAAMVVAVTAAALVRGRVWLVAVAGVLGWRFLAGDDVFRARQTAPMRVEAVVHRGELRQDAVQRVLEFGLRGFMILGAGHGPWLAMLHCRSLVPN
jgi:hypothetical protein